MKYNMAYDYFYKKLYIMLPRHRVVRGVIVDAFPFKYITNHQYFNNYIAIKSASGSVTISSLSYRLPDMRLNTAYKYYKLFG